MSFSFLTSWNKDLLLPPILMCQHQTQCMHTMHCTVPNNESACEINGGKKRKTLSVFHAQNNFVAKYQWMNLGDIFRRWTQTNHWDIVTLKRDVEKGVRCRTTQDYLLLSMAICRDCTFSELEHGIFVFQWTRNPCCNNVELSAVPAV